jgi:tetratricopeptide (TPR) repeat protein
MINRKDLEEKVSLIRSKVTSSEIKPGLDVLHELIRILGRYDLLTEYETLSENYHALLQYAIEGYQDPKRDEILNKTAIRILQLTDETWYYLSVPWFPFRNQEKIAIEKTFGDDTERMFSVLEDYFFRKKLSSVFQETGIRQDQNPASPETAIEDIFKLIWLTPYMKDIELELGQKINHSEEVEWPDKCIVVSALTLSLLLWFDERKFHLLFDYVEARENQVWQRALVGIILGLLQHDTRISFFPELMTRLKELGKETSLRHDLELVIIQLMKARETERVTKEFETEVLPDMKKMMPRIEDKLQLEDPGASQDMEGKNPGWKGMIDEVPGLFEKIEKFTRLQMEGTDVFMSTFSMLKRFDFFSRMSNWFAPFHAGHMEIHKLFSDTEEINSRLLEALEKAFYICNSDKYSFALNFLAIPAPQRTMIIAHFEAELQQMKDLATEEQLLDQSLSSDSIIIQYIQDVYRFFKLFPHRSEFDDVFQQSFFFNRFYFYTHLFYRQQFTERIAEFFFEKEHFAEAIEIYEYLLKHHAPTAEIYEKIGYGYQKSGMYRQAIEHYRKAELFDTNRIWLLKKLGWCSLKLEEYQDALNYFLDALKEQPDDLTLLSQVAQCYLGIEDYEQAFHYYSKASFLAPGTLKYLRPVAYCQFVLGKLTTAAESYNEILAFEENLTPFDLMNAGHVMLCLGKITEAMSLYRRGLKMKKIRINEFLSAFDDDIRHLRKHGIRQEDIPLIRDFILFENDSK